MRENIASKRHVSIIKEEEEQEEEIAGGWREGEGGGRRKGVLDVAFAWPASFFFFFFFFLSFFGRVKRVVITNETAASNDVRVVYSGSSATWLAFFLSFWSYRRFSLAIGSLCDRLRSLKQEFLMSIANPSRKEQNHNRNAAMRQL